MHPFLHALLFAFLACVVAACGGGGADETAGETGTTDGSDPVPDPTPLPIPGIFVSATGSDTTGNGTQDSPFRSISRAVRIAQPDDVVRVGPGLYDAGSGEQFPIEVGIGVSVRGTLDLTAFGPPRSRTFVVGGGVWDDDPEGRLHATFLPRSGATLFGLAIRNPEPFGPFDGPKPAPVILAEPLVDIVSCTLHDSDKGIRMVAGAIFAKIENTTITGNGIGVFISGAGIDNKFEGCRIVENGTGVMAFTPGVDFGGGSAGSAGGNAFADNDSNDFVYFTGVADTAFAQNCLWDVVPPTVATGNPPSAANADIWAATGTVDTTGAAKFTTGPVVVGPGAGIGP